MRRQFHRSALVRRLALALPAGAAVPADGPRQDVAERLGHWLSVLDAIGLSSAHAQLAAVRRQATSRSSAKASAATSAISAPLPPASPAATTEHLQAELARVRGVLTRSITDRQAGHRPDLQDLDTEFVFSLQAYQDQQRRMALSVQALRDHVRRVLSRGSPAQAQLAALDAALEQLLGEREQRLLGDVPAFLKARWAALRKAATRASAEASETAEVSETPPLLVAWHSFHAELEHTLLAELDHRLLPVSGLIESLTD